MTYVGDEPVPWSDGYFEALSNPAHYRVTPCAVVDYSQAQPETGPHGWEPLLTAQPQPERPSSRWARLRKAWKGEA
jgi:hypothetical protein